MDKKELAVVLGATANMTFALASVIMDLKNNINRNFDLIVYHKDISDKDQNLLNSIITCEFKDYELEPSDISNHSLNRYSLLAYSRYECFELLNNYKKVIWFDIDIFIKKDLSSLIDLEINDVALWQNDIHKNGFNFTKPIENYDMKSNYYNTGVVIFSDKMKNFELIKDWCYKKTIEYGKMLVCADQGIMNLAIQHFELKVTNLNEIYNCHPEKPIINNAVIVHPYAEEKFWNYYYNFNQWNNNYNNWLKLGGTPYKGAKAGVFNKLWIKFKKKYMPAAPDLKRHTGKFIKYIYEYNFKKAN